MLDRIAVVPFVYVTRAAIRCEPGAKVPTLNMIARPLPAVPLKSNCAAESTERGATVRFVWSNQNATDFTEVDGATKMATDPVSERPSRSTGLLRVGLVLTRSRWFTPDAGLLTVKDAVCRSTDPFSRSTSTVNVCVPLSSNRESNSLALPFGNVPLRSYGLRSCIQYGSLVRLGSST